MMIARFSPLKTAALGIFMLPFVVFPWRNVLASLSSSGLDRRQMLHDWSDWGLVLLSPIMLLVIVTFARQFMFQQGRAVWIDGEKLVFFPMYWRGRGIFRSVPLRNIDRFATGMMGSGLFKGINIYLKNGTEDEIPAHLLDEHREVVLARLNEALAAQR